MIHQPQSSPVETEASNQEASRERREWVRFVFPNLVTRLSWSIGQETVSHMVSLVNVSGNGVAVLMDAQPVPGQPCMVQFENLTSSTGPIAADLVTSETTDSGRILAKFAFQSEQPCWNLIHHQKERRAWQRVVPRERRASLSWHVGEECKTVPCTVQNISGGGVAVSVEVMPPWGQSIWLSLGPGDQQADPAECKLLGSRRDPAGHLIARLAFVHLCPLGLYQAVVNSPSQQGGR